jgi:formate-dependent nitrite reductase membrane component NrfD
MNFFVADPDWGGWIVAYFYLGGIAAGSYFIAILIEWFGTEEDQPLARIAYLIAFPLLLLCAVSLIADLDRPERFWHMMFKSEVIKDARDAGFPWTGAGWARAAHAPLLKSWSPMSAGSWGLALFGACSFFSFLAALWPKRWFGRLLLARWPHRVLQAVGCYAGFFIASYTGALLSATNQPMWSDTTWLAPLFLASAASTSLAAMVFIAWRWDVGTPAARERLEGAEPLAWGLELVLMGAFLASLGDGLTAVLLTVRGNVLVFGTLAFGILTPLLLHALVGRRRRWGMPTAAAFALFGGLLLRYGVVATPGELLRSGPQAVAGLGPENTRRAGQRGADPGNRRDAGVTPLSKLPPEEKP